ncbi:MAG TPA: RluA family pseudouridine synthase [Thermoanaerobaculia bacterium]|nr:RluA family pseudouridine synthase [Thermoanaerobaculia bacterium]
MNVLEALQRRFPDSSKTTLRQMLQGGRVRVHGAIEKNAKREVDSEASVVVVSRSEAVALPEGLSILHEDDDVIVVFKEHGLLTVATEREREQTAEAYLGEYLREKRQGRIHVVHRIDRETSGVLVFAKNFGARESLKEQFAEHSIDRVYIALIEGAMPQASGTIRSHLLERRDLRMQSVEGDPEAKFAVTHYRTVRTSGRYSMLEVRLETGRKNQIRAHLSEAGHPIVGDRFYGSTVNPLGRLGLHAKTLAFTHPTTGKRLTFSAETPPAFAHLPM